MIELDGTGRAWRAAYRVVGTAVSVSLTGGFLALCIGMLVARAVLDVVLAGLARRRRPGEGVIAAPPVERAA